MDLIHGTEQEHLQTLQRAKERKVWKIWSGDVKRNPYLRENMRFAEQKGIARFTSYNSYAQQESGWVVEWL